MLMELPGAGRALDLAAGVLGVAASASWRAMTGAYAACAAVQARPIGRFEGIEEALARIAAATPT
jgi:acyl-CoA dehydrogenase